MYFVYLLVYWIWSKEMIQWDDIWSLLVRIHSLSTFNWLMNTDEVICQKKEKRKKKKEYQWSQPNYLIWFARSNLAIFTIFLMKAGCHDNRRPLTIRYILGLLPPCLFIFGWRWIKNKKKKKQYMNRQQTH